MLCLSKQNSFYQSQYYATHGRTTKKTNRNSAIPSVEDKSFINTQRNLNKYPIKSKQLKQEVNSQIVIQAALYEAIDKHYIGYQQHAKVTIDELRQQLTKIDKYITNSETSPPTNKQLQKSLKNLQGKFPNHNINSMLSKLHEYLNHNCSLIKTGSFGNPFKQNASNKEIQIEASSSSAAQRSNDEKRVAQSFLEHGYGVKVLREVIKDQSITPTRYNNIITTIMKNTFRTIQSTIRKIKTGVVALGSQQERILRAPLVNCQKWLPPDDLQTFYSFVKGACGLGEANISTDSAMKLYRSIMKQLQQRGGQERFHKDDRPKNITFSANNNSKKRRSDGR